jgi:ubiquinone/menaquinone biosynthesis C-methylase UbiE
MDSGNEHVVRMEFQKQAKGFSDNRLSLNREDLLKWISCSLQLQANHKVLDVAAGTGILSRHLAPSVQEVISIDISLDMIAEGQRLNKTSNITNIEYLNANVEQLPVHGDSFDLVISRLAFHHFMNPSKVLGEMSRVCKPSGMISIIDMVSSEDHELSNQYNHYERLRDPSHTTALKPSEFIELFRNASLDIKLIETMDVPIDVHRWLELTNPKQEVAKNIIADITMEMQGKRTTGLSPYMEEEKMMFNQKWIKIMGIRKDH